jgi:hypothetical protein
MTNQGSGNAQASSAGHSAEKDAGLMPLADLLRDYRDGDEHGWQTEFDWLWSNDGGRMDMLTSSIQRDGIRVPILLGNDGRVWDGHHRIAAADRLGLGSVPVKIVPPSDPDWQRAWGVTPPAEPEIEHDEWCDANGCRCGNCPCLGPPACRILPPGE